MPQVTSVSPAVGNNAQSLTADQFFYFYLRVRKSEIRRTVQELRGRHPEESPEQLARRLIEAHASLSLAGGLFAFLPVLIPGIGQVLKLAGLVATTSVLTRMHLYLILEIALLHGQDIDDQARVAEMAAVVGATGLAGGVPLLMDALEWSPWFGLPASMLSASAVTQLIGDTAIRHYRGQG